MSACRIRDCQHTFGLNCVFEENRKQYHRSDFFVTSKQRKWKSRIVFTCFTPLQTALFTH